MLLGLRLLGETDMNITVIGNVEAIIGQPTNRLRILDRLARQQEERAGNTARLEHVGQCIGGTEKVLGVHFNQLRRVISIGPVSQCDHWLPLQPQQCIIKRGVNQIE